MSIVLIAVFTAVPLLALLFAYLWNFHLSKNPTAPLAIARGILIAVTAAFIVGEVINGFTKAKGFHWTFWLTGFATTLALYLILFAFPTSTKNLLLRSVAVIKSDFKDQPLAISGTKTILLSGLGLLAIGGLFYVGSLILFQFSPVFTQSVNNFINELRSVASERTLLEFMSARNCDNSRLYNPFSFALFGVANRIHPIDFYHIRMFVTGLMISITWWLNRKLPIHRLLLSSVFFLIMLSSRSYNFNISSFTETFFALVFLINFQLILNAKNTVGYFFLLGLVGGIAFETKELNFINLFLMAILLATENLSKKQFVSLALASVIGFLIPASSFIYSFFHCRMTEGLYHLPFLWFRASELSALGQGTVGVMLDQGMVFPATDIILKRLSFQTVGDIAIGAGHRFIPYLFLGVFPLFWMMANFPKKKLRLVYAFVFIGMLLYGLTNWKKGDSADPLYTMLPFGFAFAGPFFIRLARLTIDIFKRRAFLAPRSWYIFALVIFNVFFIKDFVLSTTKLVNEGRYITKVSTAGVEFGLKNPTKDQQVMVSKIRHLQYQRKIDKWFFMDHCINSDVPKPYSILFPELTMNNIDLMASLIQEIDRENIPVITEGFDKVNRELKYDLDNIDDIVIFACLEHPLPNLQELANKSPDGTFTLLDGCIRVLFVGSDYHGPILYSMQPKHCGPYIRKELHHSKGVQLHRSPIIPMAPQVDKQ